MKTDRRYLFSHRRTFFVMTGAVLGIFVASISHMMLIASVPLVISDLGGLDRYSWVFTGYFLASTVSIPLWGKISDIYGRRVPLSLAIASFVIGAIVCSAAPSMDVLIAGRALQGLGSGGIVPISMALTADLMAPRERGKWLAYLSAATVVSTMAGPVLGGWIADAFGWRWVFLTVVPLGLGALAFVWFAVRLPRPDKKHMLDFVGAGLLGSGLLAGLLATSWGGTSRPWGSPGIVGLFVLAGALLAFFVWWERRVQEPIMPLALFRVRSFSASQVGLFCNGAMHWGGQTYVPLLAQGALGASATGAGAILIPFMLSSTLTGLVTGQIVSRTGRYRPALLISPVVLFAGYLMLARLGTGLTARQVVFATIFVGVGLGLSASMWGVVGQNAAPRDQMGVVSASNQFSRVIGGTITLSILGAVMTSRVHLELARQVSSTDVSRLRPEDLLRGDKLPPAVRSVARDVYASAVPKVFFLLLGFAVVSFCAALLVERRALRTTVHDAPPEPELQPEESGVAPVFEGIPRLTADRLLGDSDAIQREPKGVR
jgi:EmrB/QacA subfamily drug resistance transporter